MVRCGVLGIMESMRYISCVLMAVFLCGCASFRPGQKVSSSDVKKAFLCSTAAPYARLNVVWRESPPVSSSDELNTDSFEVKRVFREVNPRDLADFRKRAEKIFSSCGLYSPTKGAGTLTLTLDSLDRWTYSQLMRGFLTDTPYVFIMPSALYTSHSLKVEYSGANGRGSFDKTGTVRTYFHLILAPLYPFCTPTLKESGTLDYLLNASAKQLLLMSRNPLCAR